MSWSKLILYVGRTPANDAALQKKIAGTNRLWDAVFAPEGREALRVLQHGRFDAVVADAQLPDMDGLDFLNQVAARNSEIRRVVIADLSDPNAAVKFSGITHHCLPAPWSPTVIDSALQRAFDLRLWLSNESARQLISEMPRIPSPPDLYFKVAKVLRSPTAGVEDVARLVLSDLAITAKLLQLVNSASFGVSAKVMTVFDAINYLGIETTRSLILLAHTFSYCDQTRVAGFSLEELWKHSVAVGHLASAISKSEKASIENRDETFLAGLLHDTGKLLLAVNRPQEYTAILTHARSGNIPLWQAELSFLGATHAEIGAELLATWNFPVEIVEAVALHHHPARLNERGFCPLVAVHGANALVHEIADNAPPAIDTAFIEELGLTNQLDKWRDLAVEQIHTNAS
jgi:putative nucleotidyltransferase with HDIG domain